MPIRQGNITVTSDPTNGDAYNPLGQLLPDPNGQLTTLGQTNGTLVTAQPSPLMHVNVHPDTLVGKTTTFNYELNKVSIQVSGGYRALGDVDWIYKQDEVLAYLQIYVTPDPASRIAKIPCKLTGSTFTTGSSVYIHYKINSTGANGTTTNPGTYACYINTY